MIGGAVPGIVNADEQQEQRPSAELYETVAFGGAKATGLLTGSPLLG
jgi:hypothetical protein